MNGSAVTVNGRRLPRTSAWTVAPGWMSVGSIAMAMGPPTVGPKPPEVTSATGSVALPIFDETSLVLMN